MKNDIILFLQYLAYVSDETNYNMMHVLDKVYEICNRQTSYDFQQLRRDLSKQLNFVDNFYIKLTKERPSIEVGLKNWLRRPKINADLTKVVNFSSMTEEQRAINDVERVLNELKDHRLTEPDAEKLEKIVDDFIRDSLQISSVIREDLGMKPSISYEVDKLALENLLESNWKSYISTNKIEYKTRRKIDNLVYRFRKNPNMKIRTTLDEREIDILRVYLKTHNLNYLLDEMSDSLGFVVSPKL